MRLSKRLKNTRWLGSLAVAVCLLTAAPLTLAPAAAAAAGIEVHGLSSFGDLKYPAGFQHFDYVNPEAPKGGQITLRNLNSFDSVNPFILKGTTEILNGDRGGDLSFTYATLMTRSFDEPDAVYPLVAEKALLDEDGHWVEFILRDTARFHDGTPITPDDILFSFTTLKEDGHPRYRQRYRDIETPVITGDNRIRFPFREGAFTRGLPVLVAEMPILSRKSFADRPFKETTLTPLLGSGPYKMAKVDPGRSVTYERIRNHWAEDLPVQRGRYNFDTIRVDYYRDRTIATEAFFAGEYDFREEFTARSWATEYAGKTPVDQGLIKQDVLPDASLTGFQAFFFNTRRDQFRDIRVRRGIARLFDFEWTNKNLFYGSYKRLGSVFENSDMKATGEPGPGELALLTLWRGQMPDTVFGPAFQPPLTDGSGNIRTQLRASLKDFQDAGWTVRDRKLLNAEGEQMTIEFLLYENAFTRIINPFIRNLERAGIKASIRVIDVASWQNRMQDFDFDIIVRRLGQAAYPGVELRDWWGSDAADIQGGLNLPGIKSPAVDALIEAVVQAGDRDSLKTAARSLDRVLMWGHYVIPQWYKPTHFIAYWDKFGRPDKPKPGYHRSALMTWWYDGNKAARLHTVKSQ
ncbi:extracellular solute-binding protein [Sneathiella chinensis]|uniref:ABC transporter substrate-binding protein n=1 Tax=Sneathiella chinensis TaxID=349750 RepID=A0ABQ5U1X3_9PROT|nr:extracellular solute-binding protein [Sneathiella chinensis]GLQ05421.1 ABC transporter substrate-binding protein [Sneathiella chinensis]